MPTIQSTYTENIRRGVAGFIPDMTRADLISRTVESAGGALFGVPVYQGTRAKGVTTTFDIAKFLGVVAYDRSAGGPDGFVQYESALILKKGPILVNASVVVAAGDPVAITSAGLFSNVPGAGGYTIPGARWDDTTTAINTLAQIFIK